MKEQLKWIILSSVLLFYAFLYVATTKKQNYCDSCEKFVSISNKLLKDPFVLGANQCNTAMLCVYVKDTAAHNWSNVGDSAGVYLKESGFTSFTVAIIGRNKDTLSKTKCP